jgi:mitogen-activated protein kinase kinase
MSMMKRHDRKSYLGPPAPKSLRETSTPTSNSASSPAPSSTTGANPPPISKPTRTPQQSPFPSNPVSSDLPLNDPSANHRYYPQSQSNHYVSSRSPQPPSLEHLSLETNDDSDIRSGRQAMRQHLGDPVSAIDAPTRPFMSPRSASSNTSSNSRTNLHSATLPMRPAPPNGAPPAPPVSAGGTWRNQPGRDAYH